MAKRAIESDNESEDDSRARPQALKRQRTEESDESDVGSPEPARKPSNRKAKGKARIDDFMDVIREAALANKVTINEDDEKRFEEENEEVLRTILMNKTKSQGVSSSQLIVTVFRLIDPFLGYRELRKWVSLRVWRCTSLCVTSTCRSASVHKSISSLVRHS